MLAFAIVAAAFLASTSYSQRASADIDLQAQRVISESLPSVDILSDARGELRVVRCAVEQYVHDGGTGSLPDLHAQIALDRARLDETLTEYIGPRHDLPAVRAIFDADVRGNLLRLDAAIHRAEAKVDAHEVPGHNASWRRR